MVLAKPLYSCQPKQAASSPDLLDYSDYPSVRNWYYDRILDGALEAFPVENDRYILQAENLGYDGPAEFSPSDEKKAVLTGGSLNNRLRGTLTLTDKSTGEVKDRTGRMTLMTVPALSERGEFVRKGVRYTVPRQFRVSPGAYSRVADNRMIETAFNVRPGTGHNFKLEMDPDTGVVRYKTGNRTIPFVYLMESMGVSPDALKERLGEGIYNVNKEVRPSTHARSWVSSLLNAEQRKEGEEGEEQNPVRDYFTAMELDPRSVKRTLGQEYDRVSTDALMDAGGKMVGIYRGKGDTDSRDSLAYQNVHDFGDFINEKLKRDQNRVLRNALWKITNQGSLKGTPTGMLNRHLDHFFNVSGLAEPLSEISPLDAYHQNQRVVKVGEGGIPSVQQAPLDSRSVQPSYLGYVDVVKSPESMKVGLDMYMAQNVRRGKSDNQLYTQFINPGTGEREWVSMRDASDGNIAFPTAFETDDQYIPAISHGDTMGMVHRDSVDWIVPSGAEMSSAAVNQIPLYGSNKGMRNLMGSKYSGQALPLTDPEAPLVDTLVPDETGRERALSDTLSKGSGAVYSPVSGQVSKVGDDFVEVRTQDGGKKKINLVRNLPLARKTVLDNTPSVAEGDILEEGDLVATSNFTDSKGRSAPGKNLSVAYMNYMGDTFEDALVLSESGANKLKSIGLYPVSQDKDENLTHDKTKFQTLFPGRYSKRQLGNLDDRGIAKPGSALQQGDPVILGVRERAPELSSLGRRINLDESVTWDHEIPGIVTDVADTDKGYRVYARGEDPMGVGDKLAGRFGGKGVVAKVVPDSQAIQDEEGNPIDLLINKATIPSRVNPAQIAEALLGKVARKTGRRYELPPFMGSREHGMTKEAADEFLDMNKAMHQFAKEEADKHGVSDTETLYDPRSGKKIPGVFTGNLYHYKMMQTAESKGKGRGTDFYTFEGEPGRGGPEGAKHYGSMEYQTLVGHGAADLIKDTKLIRGQRSDDFWRDVKLGRTPNMPQVPRVYEKFKDLIRAAGVNYEEHPDHDSIFAMTNKQAEKLVGNRYLQNTRTFKRDTLTPLKGGLFDPELTDFHGRGQRWSGLKLPEPVPNPVLEDSFRKILGISAKDFEQSVAEGSLKGKLEKVDVKKEMESAREQIKTGPKSKMDDAVKRYRLLKAMDERGTKPSDYLLEVMPVLPVQHRPIRRMGEMTLTSDLNHMYRELNQASQDYEDAKAADLPEEQVQEARRKMYDSVRGVVGLAEPFQNKLQEKKVGGVLQQLFGKQGAKGSFTQRRVLESNVDLAGLGVISPNPALKLNQVGLPVNQAWEIYEPFVVQQMVRNNIPATEAARRVENRDPKARQVLQKVVQQRPVLLNRAPSLHKYSTVAMWPILVEGDTVQIPPQIVGPLGADYDGNCVDYNSVIYLKLSKSALDKLPSEHYIISELNQNGDFEMIDNQKIRVRQESGSYYGSIKIGELPEEWITNPRLDKNGATVYDVHPGVEVMSYDISTGEATYYPVCRYTVEDDCPSVRVTTKSREVIVSDNESMAVFDSVTGKLKKAVPEVSEGALVPVISKDITPFGPKWNRDMGWLLGAYISDGWASERTLGFAKCEELKRKEFIRIARKDLTDNFVYYEYSQDNKYGNSVKVHLNGYASKAFKDIFGECIIDHNPEEGRLALFKYIPEFIIEEGSEEFLWGLLSGLLDCDGTIVKNTFNKNPRYSARLNTSSKYLIDSFKNLLFKLGLDYSVTTSPPRNQSRESYILAVSTLSLKNSLEKLSCVGEHEKEVLKDWTEADPTNDGRKIPVTIEEAARIRKLFPQSQDSGIYTAAANVMTGKQKSVSDRVLKRVIEGADPEEFKELKVRVDSPVGWEPIRKVERVDARQVFDLEVQPSKVFAVNNGLIVWDTASFTVPVSEGAVKDAITKMMPDRNLISGRTDKPQYTPTQEYAEGLYYLSKEPRAEKPVEFESRADMLRAYNKGDINVDTPVIVQGE